MADGIDAVIFDCDGTLVDSETISLRVLVDFVSEFGLEIPHQEALDRWAGGELPVVFGEIEQRLGHKLPEDFLEQFRKRQLSALETEVIPVEGAPQLLESMTVPFCVASNAPANKVRLCLKTTKLDRFFETSRIFSAYDIEKWKPEPDLFLMAAEQMKVTPSKTAVIEDSRFGVEAGLRAGMQVFAFDPFAKLQRQDEVHYVTSLVELIDVLS